MIDDRIDWIEVADLMADGETFWHYNRQLRIRRMAKTRWHVYRMGLCGEDRLTVVEDEAAYSPHEVMVIARQYEARIVGGE